MSKVIHRKINHTRLQWNKRWWWHGNDSIQTNCRSFVSSFSLCGLTINHSLTTRVQILASPLPVNILGQAAHAHVPLSPKSIIWHQPLAGKVTGGLVESNGMLPPGDGLKSPAGWLPVCWDQLRAQRSETSIGKLFFQTDEHASTSLLKFNKPDLFLTPNQQCYSTEMNMMLT